MEFILKLEPVSYNWDIGKLNDFVGDNNSNSDFNSARQKQENTIYTGFIAQDVEKAANELGYDFSGVVSPQNDQSIYSIRYAEFVVPLVKGMQEQQQMIEAQQEMIEELKREVEELKKR